MIRRIRGLVWVPLLALAISAVSGFSQQPTPPPASPPAQSPAPPTKPDYSQEALVFEQIMTTVRMASDGTDRRELKVRVRVQSEAGVREMGQLNFGYNTSNQSIDIASVVVHRGETTIEAPPSAVQDLTAPVARDAPVYTDTHEKVVTVPGLQPGDTLTYDIVTTTTTPFAPGQFWFAYNFQHEAIVLDDELEVNVPRDRAIKVKSHPGDDPTITDSGDRRVYLWKSSHLQKEPEDTEDKPKKKPDPFTGPDAQLTSFQSWQEVGAWFEPLERERAVPTDTIRAKALELTKDMTTDDEKMRALYSYVATQFRYVSLSFGLGRYQPHAAEDILANQYGDCKDKHTLLEALLAAVGIRAYPALISSDTKLDPDIPSPAQFDHMITAIPQGSDFIFVDATSEVAPFRALNPAIRKKQSLVIPVAWQGASPDGPAQLIWTPPDLPYPGREEIDVKGQISDLGKLSAHYSLTLRDDLEIRIRSLIRQYPKSQWTDLGKGFLQGLGYTGTVTNFQAGDPADLRNPYVIEFDAEVPNFLDWSTNHVESPLPFLDVNLWNPDELPQDPIDPVKLGDPGEVKGSIVLTFPAKYTVSVPLPVSLKRDYAEYGSTYSVSGTTITATRTMHTILDEIPPARIADLRSFVRVVAADNAQKFHLVASGEPGRPEVPLTAKADELVEAAETALNSQNYNAAVALYERVLQIDPDREGILDELGRAYTLAGQSDKAVETFKKQLAKNPYDDQANLLLAFAYYAQHDVTDAIAAAQKQLEINPLDPQATTFVGDILLEQHEYAQAAPMLEKAASLTPDNAEITVSLGRAYLNLGQTDKALAAFDRATQISPTAGIWNDVAYELAEKSLQLDRAQQYAESAVSSVSSSLRTLSLATLQPDDLGLTSGLAEMWDTLGWVYFKKGETEKAEQFIRAAWMLDQHAEGGDHLGQIEEKLGHKDAAAADYALALAAITPVPPETKDRLARVAGSADRVKTLTASAGADLSQLRAVNFGQTLKIKQDASAEFFFVFTADASGNAQLLETKFISGSDQLRAVEPQLRAAKYPVLFPDATPVRILRRGLLSCEGTTGNCTLVFFNPSDVHTLN